MGADRNSRNADLGTGQPQDEFNLERNVSSIAAVDIADLLFGACQSACAVAYIALNHCFVKTGNASPTTKLLPPIYTKSCPEASFSAALTAF